MLKRTLAALLIAALPLSVMHSAAIAADSAKEAAASPEVRKELQKLKNALGAGEMSSKQYQERKEALLSGKPK